jgi:multimeric flavodoxin WrbA
MTVADTRPAQLHSSDAHHAPSVLCIAGSPRRHGNSEQMLDALAAGVRAEGARVVRLVASEAGVKWCRGCNACSKTGQCVQRDGMDAVYEMLDGADAIVVATPVYFATVPAVLKLIFDRCQPYWARRYVLGEPAPALKRPGAILVVGGGGDPYGTACAVTVVRSAFAVLSVSGETLVECVGPDAARDIAERPEALEQARRTGAELVAAVRSQRA